MKKVFCYCFIVFAVFTVTSQNKTNNYQNLWEKVYAYELGLLPKSANSIVESIYVKAKKDKNNAQIIKSLLYKSKFSLTLEENAQLKIILQIKEEIDKATVPSKNILENILAKMYWDFLKKNRWKFYKRTETTSKINISDFRTWDSKTIFNEIHKHYKNSLKNELTTQKISLGKYNAILNNVADSKIYRPSLYDFLSHNALEFFRTNEPTINQPNYKFEIDKASYISNLESINIMPQDSSSLDLNALKTYMGNQKEVEYYLAIKKGKLPNHSKKKEICMTYRPLNILFVCTRTALQYYL